jgi:hypothetical protein
VVFAGIVEPASELGSGLYEGPLSVSGWQAQRSCGASYRIAEHAAHGQDGRLGARQDAGVRGRGYVIDRLGFGTQRRIGVAIAEVDHYMAEGQSLRGFDSPPVMGAAELAFCAPHDYCRGTLVSSPAVDGDHVPAGANGVDQDVEAAAPGTPGQGPPPTPASDLVQAGQDRLQHRPAGHRVVCSQEEEI